MVSSKTNVRYSKKCAKSKGVCFNEILWLVVMKMRLKMKNKSHRYDMDTWIGQGMVTKNKNKIVSVCEISNT